MLILKNCLGHFCIEHQIRYNVIQIRGVGGGSEPPQGFLQRAKS